MIKSFPVQKSPVFKATLLFTCYFLLIALALSRSLHYGFTGDESGYVALNTEEFASHLARPFIFIQGMDTGHPMLYAWPVAVVWRLFGQSNAAANLSMWICAALSLVAVHHLTRQILERTMGAAVPFWAGTAAALALFSTPMFISLAAQYLDPMPYLALFLWMVLGWSEGKRKTVAILGGALSLIRITGCLSVLGLGLFDLVYSWAVLQRRSWRAALGTLAPWLVSAAMFGAYLFVKLVALGRPLSTFAGHTLQFANWATIRINIRHVRSGIYGIPLHSFKLLLYLAGAALLVHLIRQRNRTAAPADAPESTRKPAKKAGSPIKSRLKAELRTGSEMAFNRPGAAAIYGAGLAAMLLPTLFACLYRLAPQPRWFIPYHAFFVIMGVHGLIVLLGRRAWLAPAILGLWCGLQVLRWHGHWVERACAGLPPAVEARLSVPPPFTLDILYRKELNQQAAGWIKAQTETQSQIQKPTLVCAYPTAGVFLDRAAGYGAPYGEVVGIERFRKERNPEGLLKEIRGSGGNVYGVVASWDLPEEQKLISEFVKGQALKEVFRQAAPSGEWIKIYASR